MGFRPFVYRLAMRHGVAGWVRNDGAGVNIEAEGQPTVVRTFRGELRSEAPNLAIVRSLHSRPLPPLGEAGFRILPSSGEARGGAPIPPDVAPCQACLAELRDPTDRRHRYPFLNCTACGPRFTIVDSLPYDRHRTTMAPFPLCPSCRAEYDDPADRRFHAQPTACPACGPSLTLWCGDRRHEGDALAGTIRRLRRGEIVALKGLGGYHLACDATRPGPVRRLRTRKDRPHKPFAVMARDLATVQRLARVSRAEQALLESWRRPIVLLRARAGGPLAPEVGGASRWIGAMLPNTPLHHLLLEGKPAALVMTSGNRRDQPIVIDDQRARDELGAFADAVLVHDRQIRVRADDSVARIVAGRAMPLRRSRGWVPQPIPLPCDGPPVLAVGGDLRNTCALTRGAIAYPGAHVGDLASPDNLDALRDSIAHLRGLLGVQPRRVVHDLHPDYHGTRLAATLGLPTLAVQHHHAHALACLAEHGRRDPALAWALDGAGHGPDGVTWGGELLAVDGLHYERIAHLRERALPGGDRAARQPWRMALAVLRDAYGSLDGLDDLPPWSAPSPALRDGVRQLLRNPRGAPRTTSAGRLFDAAASLIGLCHAMTFEGHAGLVLEQAAEHARGTLPFPHRLHDPGPGAPATVDLDPAFRAMVEATRAGVRPARLARSFHQTLAIALTDAAELARERTGLGTIALTGGVLQNAVLARMLWRQLRDRGFGVLVHRQVPPNDGGLSLGQAWAGVLAGNVST